MDDGAPTEKTVCNAMEKNNNNDENNNTTIVGDGDTARDPGSEREDGGEPGVSFQPRPPVSDTTAGEEEDGESSVVSAGYAYLCTKVPGITPLLPHLRAARVSGSGDGASRSSLLAFSESSPQSSSYTPGKNAGHNEEIGARFDKRNASSEGPRREGKSTSTSTIRTSWPRLPGGPDPDPYNKNSYTLVHRSLVTDQFIRDQIKETGRAIKITQHVEDKEVNENLIRVELGPPGPGASRPRVVDGGDGDERSSSAASTDGDSTAVEERSGQQDRKHHKTCERNRDDERKGMRKGRSEDHGRKQSRGRSRERRPRTGRRGLRRRLERGFVSDDSGPEILRTGTEDEQEHEITPDVINVESPEREKDDNEVRGSWASSAEKGRDGSSSNKHRHGSISSYFTRSKGPPGSAKRKAKATLTNKRTSSKDSWVDPSTEEDDEEGHTGRGIDIETRRAVIAQRQRREREKQQKKNRDWTSRSGAPLPALGEEEVGEPTEGQDEGRVQEIRTNQEEQQEPGHGSADPPQEMETEVHDQRSGVVSLNNARHQDEAHMSSENTAGPSARTGSTSSCQNAYLGQSNTVRNLANAVNNRCAGSGGDVLDSEEEDMEEVDGQFVRLNMTLDAMETTQNEDVVFEVADLVSPDIDIGPGGQIRVTDEIAFVVLKLDAKTDKDWTIPSPALFQKLLSRVACVCLEFDIACYRAYKWGTLWGKVGLLGLASNNLQDIKEYRAVIEDQIFRDTKFTLFPKDALEKRGNLTVLLRENLSSFNTLWLPKAILIRSRMRGGLRLTHIKHYTKEDRTRDGASKEGWRLAMLQGCPEFMENLKKFDQEHRFPIGAGHVVIRGGSGRPKGTIERVRGSRAGRQWQQKKQQHQEDDQSRSHSRSERRRREEDRDYDRNYPSWGRERDHDRERDRSSAGNRGGRDQSAKAAWGKNGPRHGHSGR